MPLVHFFASLDAAVTKEEKHTTAIDNEREGSLFHRPNAFVNVF